MEAHSRNTFEVINSTIDRRNGKLKNSPHVPQSSNHAEHHCHIRVEYVCVGYWVVLRMVDAERLI